MTMATRSGQSAAAPSPRLAKAPAAPIIAIVRRLTEVLEQETKELKSNNHDNLSYFIDQKSRSLFDLNRALTQHAESGRFVEGLDDELIRLRHAYESNRATLGIHLASVQEITEVIATAMRQAESDGTYSSRITRAGERP